VGGDSGGGLREKGEKEKIEININFYAISKRKQGKSIACHFSISRVRIDRA
jgi:hypothetical protein